MKNKHCPCGSNQLLSQCCGPFIHGDKLAKTPLQLMKSRYTAFVLGEISYIKDTMRGPALIGFNENDSKKWAKSVEWLGLTIIKTIYQEGDQSGIVEFIAKFKEKNQVKSIHEKSEFIFQEGRWYYTQGVHFTGI